jgi:hypothetical protein
VPHKYKTPRSESLGFWINNQRQSKKKENLSEDQVARLEGIGLKWSLRQKRNELDWNEMFALLEPYIAKKPG